MSLPLSLWFVRPCNTPGKKKRARNEKKSALYPRPTQLNLLGSRQGDSRRRLELSLTRKSADKGGPMDGSALESVEQSNTKQSKAKQIQVFEVTF